MLNNVPCKTLSLCGLTIEGYSRAAVQTYWRIPELRLGFDLGAQPWDFMGTGTWFLSHLHLDHMASLPVYIARRRMMKMEPPTIYLPAAAYSAAYTRLAGVIAAADHVQPVDQVREQAMEYLKRHPLRAADSLQLAAAFVAHQPTVITLDERLRKVAEAEGFVVLP